ALDAGVGHAAVAGQRAVGVWTVYLGLASVRCGVDEAAVVDLAGPGLVVLLALEVLAATDEDSGLLQGRIVLRNASGGGGVGKNLRVGEIGPRIAVVAGAAVEIALFGFAFALVPLEVLEELGRVTDDALVAVAVGGDEGHDVDAGDVVLKLHFRIAPGDVPGLGID